MARLGTIKAKIKLSPSELAKRLARKAAPSVTKKLARAERDVQNAVAQEIRRVLVSSPLIQGLSGESEGDLKGADLVAEFGIRNGEETGLVSDLLDILCNPENIRVTRVSGTTKTSKASKAVIVEFKIAAFESDDYLDELKSAAAPHEDGIPWMSILLGEDDGLIEDYGIGYKEGQAGVGLRRNKDWYASRSGRAYMFPSESELIDRFPWVVPSFARPRRAANAFLDLLANPAFRKAMADAVQRALGGKR